MRYRLSRYQYGKLWNLEKWDHTNTVFDYENRRHLFKSWYTDLRYSESEFDWGIIEGSEADITMFLLKL